ncbi:phage tail protein [Clostridioides sp. ES-S-0123-01]|uniref:phage tail protein n=1 Tax=Clostridioides sp. ES-S-0123-01 TaxID=2770783 RepID=UPI001D1107FC|nr:phage tail protein [Clostridioides sp. ES-S-0123-01]
MAEQQYFTLVTDIGKAAIANASITGEKVDFAKIKVGDGGGTSYTPTESQIALKNVVWESTLEHAQSDKDNPNWVVIQKFIPGDVGGFEIREVGLFDSKNQLLAISSYPVTYKPKADSGTVKELLIKVILVVSNVANINLKVDPTVILATLKDIQDLDAKIDTVDTKIDTTKTELTSNIETAKTEINNKIGDTTLLETTDKTNIVSAINEVKTSVDSIETTAEKTSYNNATSNLTATTVQGAIDEVVAKIETFNEININTINNILPI